MDIKKFLSKIDVFAEMTPEQIELICKNSQVEGYDESDVIIDIGNITRFLWVVYEGEVAVQIKDVFGNTKEVATLERGEIFGEMSIITGQPAVAKLIANSNVRTVKIPRDVFSNVITSNPSVLKKIAELITRRLTRPTMGAREEFGLFHPIRKEADPYDLYFSSAPEGMKILVLNCGSSSLKYFLFDTETARSIVESLIEKIGTGLSPHRIKINGERIEETFLMEEALSRVCDGKGEGSKGVDIRRCNHKGETNF